MTELHWLPEIPDWRARLRGLTSGPGSVWENAVTLAGARINFVLTNALDETLRRLLSSPPDRLPTKPVRIAVLGSSTLTHLLPAIRVAGLRRSIWIDTYENDYGQYRQELSDPASALHEFRPTAVLLALDAHELTAGVTAAMERDAVEAAMTEITERIRATWRLARETLRCPLLHQAALPVHLPLLGNNEYRLAGSRAAFLTRLNGRVRSMAEEEGVDILAIDDRAAADGIRAWHDPGLWHRAKQEVSHSAAPMYGDLVGRWVAA
jgi:predicted enzyme involved in methoxymalonyl-ACP biosynthesis